MEHRLTKRFRLVWNEKTGEIIVKGEFNDGSVTYTKHPCLETDVEKEVEKKIIDEKLISKDIKIRTGELL